MVFANLKLLPDSRHGSAAGYGRHSSAQLPLGSRFAAHHGHQRAGYRNLGVEVAVETPIDLGEIALCMGREAEHVASIILRMFDVAEHDQRKFPRDGIDSTYSAGLDVDAADRTFGDMYAWPASITERNAP